ncbi:four helix bundle protein [Draconibacterium halophilum]|uniref:Four helix bundle protein n=1 Tax=Draconibacterium halophilum TaxID=2706887 RepID=A0A6C0RF41_9BACT|nr:four helix bundle protein [Draconibacterium halophilum]QIA08759.1 four helix bundle protein [Draconibacterium halophilum]
MSTSNLALFKENMKLRTKIFAHDCVKFSLDLPKNTLGNHIHGQLIRCSTSVAANYRASCVAQSIPMIISKLSISIEEADESEFWLEFAVDEKLAIKERTEKMFQEAHEIASILIKSRQTLQKR